MVTPQNTSNSSEHLIQSDGPTYFKEPFALMVVRLCVETCIASVGLFGNIMVCAVIAKKMQKKSAINYYLFNLAVADIGVVLIIFPMAILLEQYSDRWLFGKFVCQKVYPLIDTFYGASIWFIAAVAIERYVKITRTHYEVGCSFKVGARVLVCIVWLASFLVVSLPLFFVIEFRQVEPCVCFINWPKQIWKETYTITLVVFCFVLPLSIISWTYIQIAKRLRKSSNFLKTLAQKPTKGKRTKDSKNARLKENTRARKILSPIVIAFAITMLPLNLFRLVSVYWPGVYSLEHFWTFYKILIIFTVSNSATNPLIYTVVSQEFRRGFAKMLLHNRQRLTATIKMKSDTFHTNAFFEKTRFFPERWPRPHTLRETIL